jgi:hypothetical protein
MAIILIGDYQCGRREKHDENKAQTTHPDDPPAGGRLPLSPTASHRAVKVFCFSNPLCDAVGERVVQRSVDRVSRSQRSCECLRKPNT